MRFTTLLATLVLILSVVACSGIETRPAPIAEFAAAITSITNGAVNP